MFDPRDGSLQELGPADGVDNGTGWFRAYAALSDGRLLFGGSTGVLVVAPDRLVRWNYQPPVVLTELRINGERRQPQRASPALTLGPDESSFSIEFAALDYSQPERNRYRYRLEGIDANWIETGADFRVASYGNLPPGEYRLTLQGSNRLGQWSPRMLALPVVVQPAWWQTWWARGGALAAGAGAVWGLVQLRTRLLRRRQADLEAKVQQRTQALEALSEELRQKSAALEASSLTDPLTGLHNRRFLGQHMAVDTALTLRRHGVHTPEAAWPGELDALPLPGAPAASRPGATPEGASVDGPDIVFFLIDVDHFKEVNDRHGHAAGDAVLQQVSRRLKQAFREADHVVRWGGEEFLVAARGMRRELAPELAERACQAIGGEPFVLDDGSPLHRSCSVGFAAYPLAPAWPGALPWTTTVDLADAALYVVKRSGRSGWFGLQQADAADADALRRAAKQPLADWLAQGGLHVQGSRDYAAASGTTGRP